MDKPNFNKQVLRIVGGIAIAAFFWTVAVVSYKFAFPSKVSEMKMNDATPQQTVVKSLIPAYINADSIKYYFHHDPYYFFFTEPSCGTEYCHYSAKIIGGDLVTVTYDKQSKEVLSIYYAQNTGLSLYPKLTDAEPLLAFLNNYDRKAADYFHTHFEKLLNNKKFFDNFEPYTDSVRHLRISLDHPFFILRRAVKENPDASITRDMMDLTIRIDNLSYLDKKQSPNQSRNL